MRAVIFFVAVCGYAAEVCNPADLIGPYAVQLSGTTTISGAPRPTASLARIVFDGRGNLSGTASAMFEGYLLGNPVTGTYEIKSDCTVKWKLQDDSGAYQHFSGAFSSDLARAQFKQTDPGGAQRGVMQKSSEACTAANLAKEYNFTVSGTRVSMYVAGPSRAISGKGILKVDQASGMQVDRDCTVTFTLVLPAEEEEAGGPMQMRGILVNGGREILAVQTDPGAMVSARLSAASVAQ